MDIHGINKIHMFGLFFMMSMIGEHQLVRASSHYFISAPDVFHLNQAETVSIVITDVSEFLNWTDVCPTLEELDLENDLECESDVMEQPAWLPDDVDCESFVMDTPISPDTPDSFLNISFPTQGNGAVEVSVHLDWDHRRSSSFSQKSVEVTPGTPASVEVMVTDQDLGDSQLQYVNLVATCNTNRISFTKSTKILVSTRMNVVFIQLDKPIYTPFQEVLFRVFTMDLDLKPKKIPVVAKIINPEGVVMKVYNTSDVGTFSGTDDSSGILSSKYWFNDLPVLGRWKVKVYYGYKMKEVEEEIFFLEEYKLPSFTLTLDCPDVILYTDYLNGVNIGMVAKYLFGQAPSQEEDEYELENVEGTAHIRVGLLKPKSTTGEVLFFFKKTVQLNTTSHWEDSPTNNIHVALEKELEDIEDFGFLDIVGWRLYVEATVTDKHSGRRNTQIQSKSVFSKHTFHIDLSRSPKFFAPGFYTLKIRTTYPTGAVKKEADLLVTGTYNNSQTKTTHKLNGGNQNTERIYTDEKGMYDYTFSIPQAATEIMIKVKEFKRSAHRRGAVKTEHPSEASISAKRYQSSSNSYLEVNIKEVTLKPNGWLVEATVYLTKGNGLTFPSQYYYMILSRGVIVTHGRRNILETQDPRFPLYITVTPDISPGARLLAYFVQESPGGTEVIADSAWFEVEKKCGHKDVQNKPIEVNMKTDKRGYSPSENLTLYIKANGNSDVALLAVDKAVYEINNHKSMTSRKVFDMLHTLDTGCSPGGGKNNIDVFQGAGLAVLTDLGMVVGERQQEKCEEKFIRTKREIGDQETVEKIKDCCKMGRDEARVKTKKSACISLVIKKSGESMNCKNKMLHCCINILKRKGDGIQGFSWDDDQSEDETWGDDEAWGFEEDHHVNARRNFPESFLFRTVRTSSDGRRMVTVPLPDSITTWVFQAVAIHENRGICVAEPLNVITFKKVFVKIDMPATAILREQVTVRATFYSYYDDNSNGEDARAYLYIGDGICARDIMPNVKPSPVSLGKIKEKQPKSHSWEFLPLKSGSLNITVRFQLRNGNEDKVQKRIYVKPPGEIISKSIKIPLDPNTPMSELYEDTTVARQNPIESRYQQNPPKKEVTVDLQALLPKNAVAGTTECSFKLQDHMLAPIVDKVLDEEGLYSMWRTPLNLDCGEQTISKMAPNIMASLYLKHINKLDELEKNARSLIKGSLKNELTYRLKDGSFSFWENDDDGKSTWLTAYVVKLMGFASAEFDIVLESDGEENVICKAVEWLLKQQQRGGHFDEPYAINNRGFRLVGSTHNKMTMTAHVIIALKQAQSTVQNNCEQDFDQELRKGIAYLENKIDRLRRNSTDSFTVAIVTYALVLANSQLMDDANGIVHRRMVFDEERNITHLPEYGYEDQMPVAQTAYALLSQLLLKDYDTAAAMASWLVSKQNSFGGYKASQDTIIALEALTKYKIKYEETRVNLQCTVKLQGQSDPVQSIQLDGDVEQTKPEIILTDAEFQQGKLTIEATGEGSAYALINMRYYQLQPTTQAISSCPEFSLQVEMVDDDQCTCGRKIITVHTKNLHNMNTAMGIIEIGIVTGQEVIQETLENLKNDLKIAGRLRMYTISQSGATLYFDEIPYDDELSVTIKTKVTNTGVINTHPVAVTVFDYYEPKKRCTKFYGGNLQTTGLLQHTCDASGNCQCNEN